VWTRQNPHPNILPSDKLVCVRLVSGAGELVHAGGE
jgi:hypothetical protein